MPFTYTKLTPNLIVADVDRSVAFYRDVLGFTLAMQVPDASPLVFAGMQCGPVEIFLNSAEAAYAEYPAFKERPIGGTLTQFIHVTGIEQMYADLQGKVTVVMPLEKKWYGVTEFAITDPDGYILTIAEAATPA